jgi:ankyrin repeat protein
MKALMWICHARRPLTVSELSKALSVKLGQTAISLKHCPSPNILLECCQGLVVVDSESMSIRLAHYTIQEYLIGHSDKLFLHAEAAMAATCLTYLLYDTFKEGPCFDPAVIESRIESNPFLTYASTYWGVHAQRSETDQDIQQLTFTFLASYNSVAYACQIMAFNKGRREEYWDFEECHSVTALHIASQFGLENTLQILLNQGEFPLDIATKMGTTPIIKAASRGHVAVMRMLLQRGANPYLQNRYGNALHCAAEAGYCDSIHELIRHGMSVNACQYYDRIPIFCTLDNDRASAFESLINLGADINARDEVGLSVFHRAALENCVNILDLTLRRRWTELESKSRQGCTTMHFAVIGNHTGILLKLLEAGADINAQDNNGLTPLNYATASHNDTDIVSFLLDHGAMD